MSFPVIANLERWPVLRATHGSLRVPCNLQAIVELRNRNGLVFAAALVAICVTGCSRSESTEKPTITTLAPVATVEPKSDKLGELELIATKERAYALEVPRGLRVSYRFDKAIHLEGDARGDAVANFLRARVGDGQITVGSTETVFEGVRAKVEPARVLNIRVIRLGSAQTKVVVEDVTPPPDKPGTNTERWQRAGFGPDGKPLDPTRVE
jgi:hypothetical protein